MQFHDQIVNEMDRIVDDALRGEAHSLLAEVEKAFDQDGADAISKLFENMQRRIENDFNENLRNVRSAM